MKRFVALALLVIAPIASAQQNPDWLKQAAFYQIYPSSYQDSDGNGIGDIARIQPRLGYLDSLGVNALWLKPVFKSGWDERHHARVGRQRGLIIECRTVSQPLEPRALPDSTVPPPPAASRRVRRSFR